MLLCGLMEPPLSISPSPPALLLAGDCTLQGKEREEEEVQEHRNFCDRRIFAAAIASVRELSRCAAARIRCSTGLHGPSSWAASTEGPALVNPRPEEPLTEDESTEMRATSHNKGPRRKFRFRRPPRGSRKEANAAANAPFAAPALKTGPDGHFCTASDHELDLEILRLGISFGLWMMMSVFFSSMAIAVSSADLRLAAQSTSTREMAYQSHCSLYQVSGLLGGCLLLATSLWKRMTVSHCCDYVMEQSLNRAEKAEESADSAHCAKQQFITYVFHNIRVPFNAIVLGLGHLKSKADKQLSSSELDEDTDLVKMMLDCAQTMTSVLDDVADIGQQEEGMMKLNLEEFNLLAVVKFLSWGLKDLLYQKQLSFTMSIDPVAKAVLSSNHVIGDKHRVLQTLGNFLSNAVKFTPSGGRLELNIKCEEVYQKELECPCNLGKMALVQTQDCCLSSCPNVEGSCGSSNSPMNSVHSFGGRSFAKVLIAVNDTSSGISAEDQAKLFEPYSFVTSGWVQKAGVSGLGLSIAKRFAEQSGGYIGVQSKEGEGSSFHLCIPYPLVPVVHGVVYKLPSQDELLSFLTQVHQSAQASARAPEKSQTTEQTFAAQSSHVESKEINGRRVLLVEDAVINRIVLRKVLQTLNLSCDEAENGQVAVDLCKQGRTYDLILMDKEMPVMDGHEATRQLRLMGVKTPIVALTGNALQSDKELFLEAGVDDFQTKPLSRDKLVQVLHRFGMERSFV